MVHSVQQFWRGPLTFSTTVYHICLEKYIFRVSDVTMLKKISQIGFDIFDIIFLATKGQTCRSMNIFLHF